MSGDPRACHLIVLEVEAGILVLEDGEAFLDDAHEDRLHRHGWAAAPEDRKEDLPEPVHAGQYRRVAEPGRSWTGVSHDLSG